jgi:hypothetical protein
MRAGIIDCDDTTMVRDSKGLHEEFGSHLGCLFVDRWSSISGGTTIRGFVFLAVGSLVLLLEFHLMIQKTTSSPVGTVPFCLHG